jgi:hypothetical protein
MIEGDGVSYDPVDRLTRMCGAMTETLEAHPEYREGDRAIVLLDDGDNGGIVLHAYESIPDAVTDLLGHIQAMLHSIGKRMDVVMVPDDLSRLNDE